MGKTRSTHFQNLLNHSLLRRDPHQLLGINYLPDGKKVIHLWRPGATDVYLEVKGKIVSAKEVDNGLFQYEVSEETTAFDYRVYHQNGALTLDPYAFLPTIGEHDFHFFNKGVHYQLYDLLGGRLIEHSGIKGAKFAVWAPNAQAISLVADFNQWDPRMNPMRNLGQSGIWEIFIPGLKEGEKYKFFIVDKDGKETYKSDPLALSQELRPQTASVLCNLGSYIWHDSSWLDQRQKANKSNLPMSIYEVHLGSWRRKDGQFMNYRELAVLIADYCKEMSFTHVELLPVMEHPLDESWGYQVTGFFAVTSRYGTPQDFQFFVDHLHQKGIGVILDWVPAHFPSDEFSLAHFDGTALYEHEDEKKGWHPHWNTHIFNYGRHEVSNFLIASALFWLEKMHVDGLRVDAVASMLYLDYGRDDGMWIPNEYGRNENLEAIEFLKHLNSIVHQKHPSAFMMAEDSSAFIGVTHPVEWGGLGFDLKWNMGWMNDTLSYFKEDPLFRKYHHNHLTFGLMYLYSERFMSVLSHDEVVHGKASLLSKMPGDEWQKFANLRLLYSYMMCYPGKNLIFMGGEFGQWTEWNSQEQIPWHILQYEKHNQMQKFVKDINHFYLDSSPLWAFDFDSHGFEWIDFSDVGNSVISYLRKDKGKYLACVHNFTPNYYSDYIINLSGVTAVSEKFNTDRAEFGGSGQFNESCRLVCDGEGNTRGFRVKLAPLATMIFEVQFGD